MAAKEDSEYPIELGLGGVKTIVAALRLFQETYRHRDDEAFSKDFPDIFTSEQFRFGVIAEPVPLRNDDIDRLCAQLKGFDTLC